MAPQCWISAPVLEPEERIWIAPFLFSRTTTRSASPLTGVFAFCATTMSCHFHPGAFKSSLSNHIRCSVVVQILLDRRRDRI